MTSVFDLVLREVLGTEGLFSDDAADSGGATKYGITEPLWRKYGYEGYVRDAPLDMAIVIYRKEFWEPLRCEDITMVYFPLARELFDSAVNVGPGTAARWLQRLLNVYNRQGSDYPDIAVDGAVGPATLSALRAYFDKRGPLPGPVILRGMNGLQMEHYVSLAERRPKDERFAYGWTLKRVS